MMTFMLYLNDGFDGGATRFFTDAQPAYRTPDPAKVTHSYTRRRGDALIFFSELMHDGERLAGSRDGYEPAGTPTRHAGRAQAPVA